MSALKRISVSSPPPHFTPLHLVSHEDHVATGAAPSAKRAECPVCEKTFNGAALVTGDVYQDEDHGTLAVLRRLYCDHCNHIVAWRVASSADGKRLGPILDRAILKRSPAAIDSFLRAHPQATGVQQT